MKQYKKILIYMGISIFCFTGFNSLNYHDSPLLISTVTVFAADDKKEKAPKEESEKETKDKDKKDGKEGEEEPCPECPECPDPAKVVLRGLEDKKIMIDKEQKNLVQARKELEIFEEQIDEKLENLKVLKKQIKENMALLTKKKSSREQEKEAAYEKKIGRLVKMYAGMKPKKAALIVDKMNLEVAQEIFLRMRETSAANILSFVESSKAAKISERLAFKRK